MILILIFCLALFIRVYFPFDSVFGEYVSFIGNDAYYHMRIIDSLAFNLQSPNLVDPFVRLEPTVVNYNVLHYSVAFVSSLFTGFQPDQSSISSVGAYAPAIFGSLTVFPIYYLGKSIFDSKIVGYVSAGLLAIIPGEILSRTLLGFTDHHCLEVLLTTVLLLFCVLAYKSSGWIKKTLCIVSVLVIFGVYYYTWIGSLLFLGIIALAIITWLAIKLPYRFMMPMLAVVIVSVVSIIVFNVSIFNVSINKLASFLPVGNRLLITEAHNLTLPMALGNFVTGILITPISFGIVCYLIYKYREFDKVLLIVWTLIILIITLYMRRFAYYLAVPVCLLTGYAVYIVSRYNWKVALIGSMLVLCLPMMIMSVRLAENPVNIITDDWNDGLKWLSKNADDLEWDYYGNYNNKSFKNNYTVLAYWDYGYWITREGQRSPVCNPGTESNREDIAKFLTATDYRYMQDIIESQKVRYVILDKDTYKYKWESVQNYAQSDIDKEKTLSYLMYNGNKVYGFDEIYRNENIKILKVRGVK